MRTTSRGVGPQFGRRTALRAAAVGAAGLLGPFAWRHRSEAQTPAGRPKNLVLLTWNNGLEDGSLPTGDSLNYQLSSVMAALAPYRQDMLILTGMKGGIETELLAHEQGPISLWAGSTPASFKQYASHESIDTTIARAIGDDTPFRSLHFGVQTGLVGSLGNPSYVHYSGPNRPQPSEDNPSQMYKQIFAQASGMDTTELERARRKKKSVLDFVTGRLTRLQDEVAAADRVKLEEHAASIRAIENGLDSLDQVDCSPPFADPNMDHRTAMLDARIPAVADLQTKLLATSLRCGLTRVATLMISNSDSHAHYPGVNEVDHVHAVMHLRGDAERRPINVWHMDRVADLFRELKAVQYPDGKTLLDETLVVCGSEMAIGSAHRNTPMCFFIAGHDGGYFQKGRWLRITDGSRHTKLLVSICQAMGLTGITSFGEYTGADSVGELTAARR